ncbi:MAG TPA: acyl-CoA dehydrogenase family protein [Blastocatellia bacterium]|nr:acyl-CoA dehydrogenase family protein [Blastocatellia bacterium]
MRVKIAALQEAQMAYQLNEEEQLILATVKKFLDKEVAPVASELEHKNEYPTEIVEGMKKLGLFGANVPEAYGGLDLSYTVFAMIFEEISRVWMGLAGILGTHCVLCDVLSRFGTEEQKQKYLPILARADKRGAICLSEPHAGTDLQAITTTALRQGDNYLINGSKMWITNGRRAELMLLLTKTDKDAKPAYAGMSAFITEKGEPGLTVSRDIDKLGYKSLETCELLFEDFRVPAANLIGGREGEGFKHVMTGLESERINVAARGLGIARAAFEEAIKYSQQRKTFGKAICEHQAIQLKLAEMATKLEASRLLVYAAAEKKDRGERCDLEAGMAKLFATETAQENALEAMRIFGGNGYAKDFPVERYYRDAPLLIIGGGTNELQRLVIARNLLKKYSINNS